MGTNNSVEALADPPERVRYSYELRTKLVAKFDEYKEMLVQGIKVEPDTFQLFKQFINIVRRILRDMRKEQLPKEIQDGIRRTMSAAFYLLREMAKDSGHTTPTVPGPGGEDQTTPPPNEAEEAHAKVVIETTKALAQVVVPPEEAKFMEHREVSTQLILDNISGIKNKALLEALEPIVADIKFPQKHEGDTPEFTKYKQEHTGYKGGVARFFLKIYVYLIVEGVLDPPEWLSREEVSTVSLELITELLMAEIPLTDKDMVVGPHLSEMWQVADELGVDADGVERLKNWDVTFYMNCRDIDMNHALLTKRALYFTPEGFRSVCTGVVRAAGRARTMFGVDTFEYAKREYFTNKILHRLVKNVVEDKAKSFTIPTYNRQVRMGIYWLVLIRRMVGKKNQNRKIAKIWSCAVKMGQTTSESPTAFLRELMDEFPFFSFRKNQTVEEIARWIIGKFTVAAFRSLKQEFGVYLEWGYEEEGDEPLNILPDVSMLHEAEYAQIGKMIVELHERDIELQYPSTI